MTGVKNHLIILYIYIKIRLKKKKQEQRKRNRSYYFLHSGSPVLKILLRTKNESLHERVIHENALHSQHIYCIIHDITDFSTFFKYSTLQSGKYNLDIDRCSGFEKAHQHV